MPDAAKRPDNRPLTGVKVIDFSTLLPGPLASLILAEAGADVIKVERPGLGDLMRHYPPKADGEPVLFNMLNRGKTSIAIDMKSQDDIAKVIDLLRDADVVLEQFRPGVMDRLGLGYEALKAINPGIIYCSITGYGQDGPMVNVAGHDINYIALTGMLSLVTDAEGMPQLPPLNLADIGGGTYPAVMNILMALFDRSRTGQGCYLDISMTDNVLPFLYWMLGETFAGAPPRPNGSLVTGASPRYTIYAAADGRHIAVGAIEDQFWKTFCALVQIPENASKADVAARLKTRSAAEWIDLFGDADICCTLVATPEEGLAHPHIAARGLLDNAVGVGADEIPALPMPLAPVYRDGERLRLAPALPRAS